MQKSEEMQVSAVVSALQSLRVPIQQGEYDLHHLVMNALEEAGIACRHEVSLAPRCRIDLMCGHVGIEMKRGKPVRSSLIRQVTRYAQCDDIAAVVVVAERSVDLPRTLAGKPIYLVCLNRLWGIAL